MESSELILKRRDVLQTAPSNVGTLKILPLSKSQRQKVAVGDTDGVIQLFSIRKGELVSAFKHLPVGQPITKVELGRGQGQLDKIFFTYGQTVKGVNKKGKAFFQYNSKITEDIKSIRVKGTTMWTAGDYSYNQVSKYEETAQYISRDRINDMIVTRISGLYELAPILVCQDRYIRVIQESKVYYEAALDEVPTAVAEVESVLSGAGGIELAIGKTEIVYGTEKGSIGQLNLDLDAIRRGWSISVESTAGSVNCLSAKYDFTKDGVPDIVVGRGGGNVEIYSTGTDSGTPERVLCQNVGDSVSSVEYGFVSDAAKEDLAIHTFSGKVLLLNDRVAVADPADGQDPGSAYEAAVSDGKYLEELRKEVGALKSKLEAEKGMAVSHSDSILASNSIDSVKMNVKHVFNERDCTQSIKIEAATPFDVVALNSEVPLEFIDTLESDAKEQPMINLCPPKGKYSTIATFRFEDVASRLEIRFKSNEGKQGLVHIYIIPKVALQLCECHTVEMKALCLHQADNSMTPKEYSERPLNKLSVAGSFSMQEMHQWIRMCLPDVSSRSPQKEVETLYFRNVFIGSCLVVTYCNGEGTFHSESIATLAVVRDVITQSATQEKQRLDISFEVNEDSVPFFCNLVYPKFQELIYVSKQSTFIEALHEIRMQEQSLDCFTEGQKAMIARTEREGTKERSDDASKKTFELQNLTALLKQYYVDWHKFIGITARKQHGAILSELLKRREITANDLVLYFTDAV